MEPGGTCEWWQQTKVDRQADRQTHKRTFWDRDVRNSDSGKQNGASLMSS